MFKHLQPVLGWLLSAALLAAIATSAAAQVTPIVATTTYSYNETGAKTRQVDALGRTTT